MCLDDFVLLLGTASHTHTHTHTHRQTVMQDRNPVADAFAAAHRGTNTVRSALTTLVGSGVKANSKQAAGASVPGRGVRNARFNKVGDRVFSYNVRCSLLVLRYRARIAFRGNSLWHCPSLVPTDIMRAT